MHTFGGIAIWGSPTQTVKGPVGKYRAQIERLPGVSGARVYRLGRDPLLWVVRGRLSAYNLTSLLGAIASAVAMENGQLYAFADSSGTVWTNCLLSDYTAIGEPEGCVFSDTTAGVTVLVQANVQCMSPGGALA